jgi:hypothetical protein
LSPELIKWLKTVFLCQSFAISWDVFSAAKAEAFQSLSKASSIVDETSSCCNAASSLSKDL